MPSIDDRWLWLGFGIFFLAATRGVQYALKDLVQLTELEPLPPEPKDVKKDLPEDGTLNRFDITTTGANRPLQIYLWRI